MSLLRHDLAFPPSPAPAPAAAPETIEAILRAVREHLDMDVAFVSRVAEGQVLIQHADHRGASLIQVGDKIAAEQSYCARVIDGRLPFLIPDTARQPEAAALACTREIPIGAHISVPLRLSDGSIHGTFCCFRRTADPGLAERDVATLQAFAEVAAGQIETGLADARQRDALADRIRDQIVLGGPDIHLQPIVRLSDRATIGFEALARFPAGPGPAQWFRQARLVGLAAQLELAALARAVELLPRLPAGTFLTANLSPSALAHPDVDTILGFHPPDRLVIEIMEQAAINEVAPLRRAVARLRGRVRFALDDVGKGCSDLKHIVELAPAFLKLDGSLVQGIARDPARQALARALNRLGDELGCRWIAEGVESEDDCAMLAGLGVHAAQGFLLGRPAPPDQAIR